MKSFFLGILLFVGHGCGPNSTTAPSNSNRTGSNQLGDPVQGAEIQNFSYKWVHQVSQNGFDCNSYSADLKIVLSKPAEVEFQICSKASCWALASINCSTSNCTALDAGGSDITKNLNISSLEYSLVKIGKVPACAQDTINSFKIKTRVKGHSQWIEANCSDYKTIPTDFFICP